MKTSLHPNRAPLPASAGVPVHTVNRPLPFTANALDTIAHRLALDVPPAHCDYISKRSAADYLMMIAQDLRTHSILTQHAALVAALEADCARIEQLCGMVNGYALRLGFGPKVRSEDFTEQARAALAAARRE